jgi:hypothetical protein
MLLDKSDRPDERFARGIVAIALRQAYLWFARWTAWVAALVWGFAVLLALMSAGSAA